MGETIRFGVSMDSDLVELLDKMTVKTDTRTAPKHFRALVRQELVSMHSGEEGA